MRLLVAKMHIQLCHYDTIDAPKKKTALTAVLMKITITERAGLRA